MGRNLLFLDFDGVLHPTTATDEQLFCRIPVLKQALAGLECDIVISSSWRNFYRTEELLAHFPQTIRQRIVGFTGAAHIGKWPRFQEIQNYLMTHGNPNWRALDDALLEFPKRCKELLFCNPNVGIDIAQANDLTHWLESCATHH